MSLVARVLYAYVSDDWHDEVAAAVEIAGYADAGLARDGDEVRRACADRSVDVFVVGRAADDDEALALVRFLAQDGSCPVIVALPDSDPVFVNAAAELGAFAFVVGAAGRDWEAALALARARHRQYRGLQDAFARRAVVERAKGILMERQGIEEDEAFRLLREYARSHSRRVADVAESVLESHRLLQPPPAA